MEKKEKFMKRIAKFEKVSFAGFQTDYKKTFPDWHGESLAALYQKIRLPVRATSGSAGYDFFRRMIARLKAVFA